MSALEILHQDGAPDVHVWVSGGQRWACVAADHGPHCRLCQPCDDFLNEILDNIREGFAVAKAAADGSFLFKLTAKGNARVESMLGSDPEAARFYADVQRERRDNG